MINLKIISKIYLTKSLGHSDDWRYYSFKTNKKIVIGNDSDMSNIVHVVIDNEQAYTLDCSDRYLEYCIPDKPITITPEIKNHIIKCMKKFGYKITNI